LTEKEFKKLIKKYYVDILQRDPDEDGINYYLEKLHNKEITTEEIPLLLKKSGEYLQKEKLNETRKKFSHTVPNALRILVLGTFEADSSMGGGKYIIHNLFKQLSTNNHITYLSIIENGKPGKEVAINKNFLNIQIPENTESAKIRWELEKTHNVGLFDVHQIEGWKKNIEYLKIVKSNIENADVIIIVHPYLANLVKSLNPQIPIIYHAIDLEFNQKKFILKGRILENVKKIEETACKISDQIWTTSETERNEFLSLYTVKPEKLKVLPHGVDLNNTFFISRKKHNKSKDSNPMFQNKTISLFTGSWHPPNLEALEFIIEKLAPINKNHIFLIIGSVKDNYYFKHPKVTIPENVIMFGTVSNEEKFAIYELADFALNPIFSGAGTNMKVLEYMATGIPIITTDFGARGIKLSPKTPICRKDEFIKFMQNLITQNFELQSSINENFLIIKQNYDYELIGKKCMNYIYEIFSKPIEILSNLFYNVILELNRLQVSSENKLIKTISKEISLLCDKTTLDEKTYFKS